MIWPSRPFGEYMFIWLVRPPEFYIHAKEVHFGIPFARKKKKKTRCAKYEFAERSHNFLMQLPMQLNFSCRWDLDKLQTCAKGKSILEFRSVWKEIQKTKN